jgi:hypothetical protein
LLDHFGKILLRPYNLSGLIGALFLYVALFDWIDGEYANLACSNDNCILNLSWQKEMLIGVGLILGAFLRSCLENLEVDCYEGCHCQLVDCSQIPSRYEKTQLRKQRNIERYRGLK